MVEKQYEDAGMKRNTIEIDVDRKQLMNGVAKLRRCSKQMRETADAIDSMLLWVQKEVRRYYKGKKYTGLNDDNSSKLEKL